MRDPALASVRSTSAPGHHVVLFDGECPFCTQSAARLERFARRGALQKLNFHADGVLEQFPGITHAACMRAMHVVTPDGRVHVGAAAIVQALRTRPFLGSFALVYYVPGIRFLADLVYDVVADSRYRLFGRAPHATCRDGLCSLPRVTPRKDRQ